MRSPVLFLSVLFLSCAAELAAAVSYKVETFGTAFGKQLGTFEVVADDGRIRARSISTPEGEPTLHDGLLWLHGSPVVALNSTNETWYHLDDPTPFAASSRYMNPVPKPSVRNVTMHLDDAGVEDGKRHSVVRLSYEVRSNFHGGPVSVFCTATFEVTTSATVERRFWMGRVFPVTGLPEVDRELARADGAIGELPLRIALTATRRYAGGAEMAESMVIETSEVTTVTTPEPSLFTRPPGYRQQKPVVAGPGAGLR